MRRDGGEAAPRTDGCWILFRLGRIFALCSFLNSKSDVGMVAARGAHAIECAHARRVIRGWMGPWDGRDRGEGGGGVVRSFVTSLWRFNVKVDRRATETSDFFPTKRDQNSPSSSLSSRARRPPVRLFLCHCSRKSNASFPAAAARLDVACTRAPADCRYADVP